MAEGGAPDIEQLIVAAATGIRRLTVVELRAVREYVAAAGFNPEPNASAQGLAGVVWQGRVLKGTDRLPAGEAHYLDHVVQLQEWPVGTTLQGYYDSISSLILDHRSGVLTSAYGTRLQLTIVGRTRQDRGPGGAELILVEYRVELGHWVTAFQPTDGLRVFRNARRTGIRWLRLPH